MDEISFTIFNHSPAASTQMAQLLKQFEEEEKIHVRLEVIPWSMGWQKLVEMGLYQTGADISEIGSTWTMDLVRMDALRPYSKDEVDTITNGRRYFDSAWKGGVHSDQRGQTIWGIPLAGDTRAIFYRKDWLQKAGVDETTAFNSHSRFDQTLAILKAAGCSMPLSLPTGRLRNNIHGAASWVWGLNGDFLSADGTKIEFDHEHALDGFKAYYSLGRYLGSERILTETDSNTAFRFGQSAVTFSGYSILHEKQEPIVAENMGVASVPGTPFVGGEHLVIWKHARHPEQALRFAQFLARPSSSSHLYPLFGLPVAIDGWDQAPFTTPNYQIFRDALQNGRSFPSGPLWGLVEKRLSETLADIWTEVFAHPERTDTIVENQLGALAKRLQIAIR